MAQERVHRPDLPDASMRPRPKSRGNCTWNVSPGSASSSFNEAAAEEPRKFGRRSTDASRQG